MPFLIFIFVNLLKIHIENYTLYIKKLIIVFILDYIYIIQYFFNDSKVYYVIVFLFLEIEIFFIA